jgi:hypothetical protein
VLDPAGGRAVVAALAPRAENGALMLLSPKVRVVTLGPRIPTCSFRSRLIDQRPLKCGRRFFNKRARGLAMILGSSGCNLAGRFEIQKIGSVPISAASKFRFIRASATRGPCANFRHSVMVESSSSASRTAIPTI